MRYNEMFANITDERALRSVSQADLPTLFRLAVREGWMRGENDTWLLKKFFSTYSGSPTEFSDATGYEAAVNGRAVPDIDLVSGGIERARELAKRAYAFARMALLCLNETPGHPPAASYISISFVEMGDEVCTANITFVTRHNGEPPYIDSVEGVTSSAVLAVDSSECIEPLPLA